MSDSTLTDAHVALIRLLAAQAVDEHLSAATDEVKYTLIDEAEPERAEEQTA